MNKLKRILWGIVCLLVILNLAILISGRTYLYKAIANTYLKGRSGASIDEYQIFDNREVKAGKHQKWALGIDYNAQPIPDNYLNTIEKYETIAYLIVKDDSIRFEQYWDGYSEDSYTNSFSMAKSIVSILVGVAIDEGKIKSVDQSVGDFLESYQEGDRAKLTIKHLLTMSSGMNFEESYKSPFDFPAESYFGSDLRKLVSEYDVVEEPGRVFEYLSGNTQLLAFVLEKATGVKVSEYASEKLWKPIGAKNPARWSLDHENGDEKAYCCFNSNTRDFARIGQLYLNKGNWKGRQIVSEDYVKRSIIPADLIEEDDGTKIDRYGYSWWLVNYKGHRIFFAEGLMGQYIIVIPDKEVIVVRLARKRAKEKIKRRPADLYVYIDHALEMY
ncbi:serine hydrolase [bacterium AH-315-M05]|nr:serine hydrolase [bacterium AH-315-M05]